MEVLFDETYTSSDGTRKSRNIWYGYADVAIKGAHGLNLELTESFGGSLCSIIKSDLAASKDDPPTETNWYFYVNALARDAVGDSVRPSIMVRERGGSFFTNINMSDHNFAVDLDGILSFKANLDARLSKTVSS